MIQQRFLQAVLLVSMFTFRVAYSQQAPNSRTKSATKAKSSSGSKRSVGIKSSAGGGTRTPPKQRTGPKGAVTATSAPTPVTPITAIAPPALAAPAQAPAGVPISPPTYSLTPSQQRAASKSSTTAVFVDPTLANPFTSYANSLSLTSTSKDAEATGTVAGLLFSRNGKVLIPGSLRVTVPLSTGSTDTRAVLLGGLQSTFRAGSSIGLALPLGQAGLSTIAIDLGAFQQDSLRYVLAKSEFIVTRQRELSLRIVARFTAAQGIYYISAFPIPTLVIPNPLPKLPNSSQINIVVNDQIQIKSGLASFNRLLNYINTVPALEAQANALHLNDSLSAIYTSLAAIDVGIRNLQKTKANYVDSEDASKAYKSVITQYPSYIVFNYGLTYGRKKFTFIQDTSNLRSSDKIIYPDVFQNSFGINIFKGYSTNSKTRISGFINYTYSSDYKGGNSTTFLVPVTNQPGLFYQRNAIVGSPKISYTSFVQLGARFSIVDIKNKNTAMFAIAPTYTLGFNFNASENLTDSPYSIYIPVYLFQSKTDNDQVSKGVNGGVFLDIEGNQGINALVPGKVKDVQFGVFISKLFDPFSIN